MNLTSKIPLNLTASTKNAPPPTLVPSVYRQRLTGVDGAAKAA
jgi:hypothetical protein